jgi:hypothetical protein
VLDRATVTEVLPLSRGAELDIFPLEPQLVVKADAAATINVKQMANNRREDEEAKRIKSSVWSPKAENLNRAKPACGPDPRHKIDRASIALKSSVDS